DGSAGTIPRARRVFRFPALGADPYQGIPPHFRTSCERVTALAAAAAGEWGFLIVPARALTTPLPPPERLLRLRTTLSGGGLRAPPEPFLASLVAGGYRHEEVVGSAGEFSRRGGIVDVFPPGAERPYRVELEGDEIASIRTFDTDTQRSVRLVEDIEVLPV